MYSIPIGLYISYILMKKLIGRYLRWSALIPLSLLVGVITAIIMTLLSSLFTLFFFYYQDAPFRPDIRQSLTFTLIWASTIYPIACLIMLPFLRKQFIKKQLLKRVHQQQASLINPNETTSSEVMNQDQKIALDKIASSYKTKYAEKHRICFEHMKSAYVDIIENTMSENLWGEDLLYREAVNKETGSILYTLSEYALHSVNRDNKKGGFDPTLSAEILLGEYWIPYLLTECQLEHSIASKKSLKDYFLAPSSNQYRILFAKIIKYEQSKESAPNSNELKQKLYQQYLNNCIEKNDLKENLVTDLEFDFQAEYHSQSENYKQRVENFTMIILRLYEQVSRV